MANQPNSENRGPIVKVVTTLPPVGDTAIGELLFLISDSKLYLRVTAGYIATAALS